MIEVDDPYDCLRCPLIDCNGFQPPSEEQRAFLNEFKQREVRIDKGEVLFAEGEHVNSLFTILNGVMLRYRSLEDGRRQIVNIMFPGDLVGLQGVFEEPSDHTVEALVPGRLCVFERARFTHLIESNPQLGFDVTWLAAKEEAALERHLVSLGQRTARERLVRLAVWLLDRAYSTGMVTDRNRMKLGITQSQISDMLGLSLVHTNRTIRSLAAEGLVEWNAREIHIPDSKRAIAFADYESELREKRPYI